MITFVNKTPELANIGDLLCSPRHYFKFRTDKQVVIVGGGAFNDFGSTALKRHPAEIKIGWAIGRSVRFRQFPSLRSFFFNPKQYSAISTRDKLRSNKNIPFVPCVSVFSPLSYLAPGHQVAVVLNADPAVSSGHVSHIVETYQHSNPDTLIFDNSFNYKDFYSCFLKAGLVITNSYHAAYWSFLSGREVVLIGYSSKFLSLLDMFSVHRSRLIRYKRGDLKSLRIAIDQALKKENPIRITDSLIGEFKDRNITYANSLSRFGVDACLQSENEISQNLSGL